MRAALALAWLTLAAFVAVGCFACVTLHAAGAAPQRPDPRLTPGAVRSPAPSLKQLCTPGYSSAVRNVPDSEKQAVYRAYGITPSHHGSKSDYEVDHLISLELGGSNDPANLWPQSYLTTPYNAHVKDALENRLHWLVCHAQLPVATAQAAIRRDWTAAYKHYVQQNATKP